MVFCQTSHSSLHRKYLKCVWGGVWEGQVGIGWVNEQSMFANLSMKLRAKFLALCPSPKASRMKSIA